MAKFMHHKYEWSKPFGSPRHQWSLVGPEGGVHFTASFYSNTVQPSCGLEFHYTRTSGKYSDEAPHHTKCWLTGEPCWHDGTSLYAEETMWPMIEPMLRSGDHDTIFRALEREYERGSESPRP